jgi:glycerol uptake facilitator-like aquaporin
MTTIRKKDIRDFVVEALGVFSLCYFGGLSCISLPYTLPIFGTDKDIGIPVTLPIAVAHGIILAMLIIIGGTVKAVQYNPAVTIALFWTNRITKSEMFWNMAGQASGSTLAGLLLMFFQVKGKPKTRKWSLSCFRLIFRYNY